MKILWLSNRIISSSDLGVSGTWLLALANALRNIPGIELANITHSYLNEIQFQNVLGVSQWLIPANGIRHNGLPKAKIKKKIIDIIYDYNPDIIHVWGTESYWGFITADIVRDYHVLIEIQGLIKDIAKQYKGGLTLIEIIKCIGIKEIVRLNSIFNSISKYSKWGNIENEIIKKHTIFSTHSDWAESKVRELNNKCVMFKNERILRPEFYLAKPWTYNNSAVLFTFLGYASPFKGLHVLIESLRILKREFPDIKLYIAGSNQLEGLRRDGYLNFINNIIKRNDLTDNVIWLGPLSANEIIKYLYLSAVAVFPSFIESYGVALAESMMIGVPSVAAYNGGYSYLGNDHENVLFFPPGESSLCAFQINKILSDKNLTIKLSINSRLAALKRNDFNNVLKQQIHIYQEIPHLNTPHLQVQN